MSLMCAYQSCLCIKYPCGSTAFFRLPTDERRSIWIKNSGNKSLLNISAKSHRFFCENHFRECDIRNQFNRKILRKQAVPIEHESCKTTLNSVVPKPISIESDYSRLNKNRDDCQKKKTETNLIIEKLENEPRALHLYEEVELTELENQADDITIDEEFDNSYLIDFNSPPSVEAESAELQESKLYSFKEGEELDTDPEEINFEEANCNEVDSSVFDLHQDSVNAPEELESQPEIQPKKRKHSEDAYTASNHNEKNTLKVPISNNGYEEDKHFALSLVGYFQRLPNAHKALAKLKILQYLTDLEIGLPADLEK